MAYEFKLTRRVEFAETDMAGIVHFSSYFLYMEQAEHAFFRSLGYSVHTQTDDGWISFPRVSVQCEYEQPLRFEDEVEVHLLVRKLKEKSIAYDFVFRKLGDQPVVVARGSAIVGCAKGDIAADEVKAMAIPQELVCELEQAPRDLLN